MWKTLNERFIAVMVGMVVGSMIAMVVTLTLLGFGGKNDVKVPRCKTYFHNAATDAETDFMVVCR